MSGHLKSCFASTAVTGMLKGKVHCTVSIKFLSTATIIGQTTEYSDEPNLTAVHTMYLGFVNYTIFVPCCLTGSMIFTYNLMVIILKVKVVVKGIFGNLEDIDLFTFQSYLLNHVAKDKSRFELLIYLDASSYKHLYFETE